MDHHLTPADEPGPGQMPMPGMIKNLGRILMGTNATFHNRHRIWLYGGFCLLVVAVIVLAAVAKSNLK